MRHRIFRLRVHTSAFSLAGFALSGILFALLVGCGGGLNPASVAVTASATTVDATDSVTLTAAVTNDKNSAGVSWTVSGGGTLSSQTTTGATYTAPAASSTALTVTVTATSIADTTKTASATLTVPTAPAITNSSLAAGAVGTAYSVQLAASGGIPPYTFSVNSGTLPSCLTITAGGLISGTPTASCAGSASLTFKVTDSGTATALTAVSGSLNLVIAAAPAIVLPAPATLVAGTYNQAYTGTVAATGGAGTLTYSVSAGALPTGLSLTPAGAITGTPTAAGTFGFTIKAADAYGDSATQAYSVAVSYPPVKVTATTLPTGYVGSIYTQTTLAATGGSGTGYTWALANGSSLPVGLSLSTGGVITGTPTGTPGTTNFSVTVTDSAQNTGNGSFSIIVDAGVSITTSSTLPTGYVGTSYSKQLAATGGTGTGYTWAVSNGSTLPGGLTLSSSGLLSGTPTLTGTPSFSVTVTDSAQSTASATFSLTIDAGVTVTPAVLPVGYPGTAYPSTTLAAIGGTGTGYTWSWAAANGSTLPAGLSLSAAGVITGTPTNATSSNVVSNVVITAKDSVGNTGSANFSVTIEATLVVATAATLPSGVVNVVYAQTLAATGGSGGYSWATNNAGTTSLASVNLTLNASGLVSGTPSGAGSATFAATVTDSASHTATITFSVTVYTNSQVNGQISLANSCGLSTLPTFNVSINTSPVQNTTTDSNGNYSFASVPNGTYTITPSINGPSSVFYPATLTNVVVNNSNLNGENFNTSLGYTVSGVVTYAGTKTGQVYITLNNSNCGGNSPNGTSITNATLTSGGAYTVRNVPPGSYTLQGLMDHLGNGAANATDPTGSASVTVSTANVTGADVTITDQSVTTPTSGPSINAITPGNLGVVISYGALTNSNGVETVGSYTVEWSTDSGFSTTSSYSYTAVGTNANIWILNNGLVNMTGSFANGTAYYFRARGNLSNGTIHTPWTVYGGGTPTAVTVGATSGYNTITGTVTIPTAITPTGPLYVGFYNSNNGQVYATAIASPSNSTANAFTVSVPSGSGYFLFGILDQNNDGLIDAGDVSNTKNNGGLTTVTISGNLTGQDITLPSADSTVAVTTQYQQSISSGGTSSNYTLAFDVRGANKLPVSVTLALASNPNVVTPVDIGVCGSNCGDSQYQYYTGIGSDVPQVGDTYTFDVTYSDATTGTVTGTVTAVLTSSNAPTSLAASGTSSTSTTPTFTWTDPANASNYTYQFYISDNNGNTIWQIPGNNSNSNGFASTITSIVWGTDPTGDSSNTPSVGSLTTGTTYTWQIELQDSNGNQAATQVNYTP